MPDPAPVISIVTPALNHARFLEKTISSIVGQAYPRLEYVVQDGRSTDGSVAILERYARSLHHWESAPDSGQANAINRGFAHTTGEIMAYINSDDVVLPGALAFVASYFARHPHVDAIYSHRLIIDMQDLEIGRWILPRHDDDVLSWADYVPQETLFWRRRIWTAAGGCIDESFDFAIDWELLVRFLAHGAHIVRVPTFLSAFRVHEAQKSLAATDVGRVEMARVRERIHGRPVDEGEVHRAVRPYLLRHAVYRHLYRAGLTRR